MVSILPFKNCVLFFKSCVYYKVMEFAGNDQAATGSEVAAPFFEYPE